MGLSFTTREFAISDGLTYAANDTRLTFSATSSGVGGASNALATGSGVRPAPASPMLVSVASGLSVTVNMGFAVIQGSAAANSGAYIVTLDSVPTLTCTAADTVNPRIDSVCVTVVDDGNTSSNSVVQIITGTPAASPSAPALPADSLLLCNITVAANATTLSSGNLSDQRTFYASAGGVKIVNKASFYPTSGEPCWIYDLNLGRFKFFNGTSVVTPKVAAFAPSTASSSVTTAAGVAVTIVSQSITVDGSTNVKCTLTWGYINTSSTSAGNGCTIAAIRGSSSVGSASSYCTANDSTQAGGTLVFIDVAPAAGTYTYSWTLENQGVGVFGVHNAVGYWEAQLP